jgi:hypothetical protein
MMNKPGANGVLNQHRHPSTAAHPIQEAVFSIRPVGNGDLEVPAIIQKTSA